MTKLLDWIIYAYDEKVRTILMGQADINTQVQNIQAVTADLLEILTQVQEDLSGQGVDTTQLDAAVTALQAADAQLKAAVTPASDVITVTNPGSLESSMSGGDVDVQIAATDSNVSEALTFSATGLPAGLSIDASGLISGTPTAEGTNSVEVTATDSTGASGSAAFVWNVTA
jgi:hypothetical protein